MKLVAAYLLVTILAAPWSGSARAADGPPALSHNPFSRPSSAIIRLDRAIDASEDGAASSLPLHATMVGRVNRLANVAGRILKPGDEYEGHRLVEVHERYVVFEKDGKRLTVYVKPLQTEDNG